MADDPPPFFSARAPLTTARPADPPGHRLPLRQNLPSFSAIRLQMTLLERDSRTTRAFLWAMQTSIILDAELGERHAGGNLLD